MSHGLLVPSFHFSLQKSVKHFGNDFVFDNAKIWYDLLVNGCSAASIASLRNKAQNLPVSQSIQNNHPTSLVSSQV